MICTVHIPWIGPLPFYARFFLDCCGSARQILWVVHSDQVAPALPDNVVWFQGVDVRERVRRILPHDMPDRIPGHKLCDLKPYWHLMFDEPCLPRTEYLGWCDWDVAHNLADLRFDFEAGKFSAGFQCGPLFLFRRDRFLDYWPVSPGSLLRSPRTLAWDERFYLPQCSATIIQPGMTPEVDLTGRPEYALHLYRGKTSRLLYAHWLKRHCPVRLSLETEAGFSILSG